MNKRGDAQELVLSHTFVTVLALGVVLPMMLYYVYSVYEDTHFEKQYLAVNLALALDAVQSVNGNLDVIIAPQKFTDKFSYLITKNKVEVFEKEDEPGSGRYYFALRKDLNFQQEILQKNEEQVLPRITKLGNNLEVSDVNTLNSRKSIHTIECPAEETEVKKIFIKDTLLGTKFKDLLSQSYFIVNSENESDTNIITSSEDRKDGKNILKVYIADNKSERLACEVLNSIADKLLADFRIDLDGTSVVFVNKAHKTNPNFEYLTSQKTSVALVLPKLEKNVINSIPLFIKEAIDNARV